MSAAPAALGTGPRPGAPPRLARPERDAGGTAAALLARALPPFALGAYGAIRWGDLVSPAAAGRTALGALAALAAVSAAMLARRRRGRLAGGAALAAGVLVALAVVLATAGVRARLLAPAHLSALWSGLFQGIGDLPGVTVPYRGVDPWTRIVIVLGGELLLLASAAGVARAWATDREGSAGTGRTRVLAALPLLVLCGVPMALLDNEAPAAQGALLFVLLAAFLWFDRLPRGGRTAALGLVLVAAVAGALAEPLLDRPKPWFDYLAIADRLAASGAETFDWSQHYGPISWPRHGREVLRVRSRRPLYLKAENLDGFDGLGWVQTAAHPAGIGNELPDGAPLARYVSTVSVSVRALRLPEVIGAGTTLSVDRLGKGTLAAESPGTFVVKGRLTRGDSYTASVYYPRPSRSELEHDRGQLPPWTSDYLSIALPVRLGRGWTSGGRRIGFSQWAPQSAAPVTASPAGPVFGDSVLRQSPYAGAWALARRLQAASSSPYDYARRVRAYLTTRFTYSERPEPAAVPLADFLDHTHVGYCQQFAGTMALLLRMGGVPARVAVGFSPGIYDGGLREWVVSDFDAHAWVEAWFPSFGWVTFDPTPSFSPALRGVVSAALRGGAVAPGGLDATRRGPAPAPAAVPHAAGASVGTTAVVAIVVAVLLLALLARRLRARRRRPSPADPHLAELERALGLMGRSVAPPLTLRELEQRFRATPLAAAYVRTVSAARFRGEGRAPTTAERRGLRSELARGRGLRGELRALRAVPPRPRWR